MIFWELLFEALFIFLRQDSFLFDDVKGRKIQLVFLRWLPVQAITIGRTIFTIDNRIKQNPRLLNHELVHVDQWDEHPYTFPFLYLWASLVAGFKGKDIYYGNKYEEQAYGKVAPSSLKNWIKNTGLLVLILTLSWII